MGPPAMAAVTAASGDRKYLDLANRLWWKTHEYLYDRNEKLYYRDSRYFEQREQNGQKVFWSRGNGWVFAGLARLLQDMPADYPDRPRYVALFKEMAAKVASLQGADGYWRASLLDSVSMPNPETSGTGFFVFSLAWGINKACSSEPTASRRAPGWAAMVRQCGRRNARLGSAVATSRAPRAGDREGGVGACCRGSGRHRLAGK
jgi:rhamnogalacturonyl hydrolase YesR